MRNDILKIEALWGKLKSKLYRAEYAARHACNSISAQIFFLRERRGWTQADLARETGMKQPAISRLERSGQNVTLGTLARIAEAFDVALSVRFVPFSEMAIEVAHDNLDRAVRPFEQDACKARVTVIGEKAYATSEIHVSGVVRPVKYKANDNHDAPMPYSLGSGNRGALYYAS